VSRTLKDRPYWVAINDEHYHARYIQHNHHKAGLIQRDYDYPRDENGHIIYETRNGFNHTHYMLTLNDGSQKLIPKKNWEVYYGVSTQPARHSTTDLPYRCYQFINSKNRKRIQNVIEYKAYGENYEYLALPSKKYIEVGTYSEECSEDVKLSYNDRYGHRAPGVLCYPTLNWRNHYNEYYKNRPQPDEKRNHHKTGRSAERDDLTRATKLYNGGEDDMWGDDFEKAYTSRQRRHSGWWD